MVAYLATRLVSLDLLPMFLDERLHVRWALWIAEGQRLRLPSISGRGLNVWLLAAIAPHVSDPIFAGRMLTVAIGALALVATHELARVLFGPRAALLAAVFYVVCPFTLFHDRMVLNDAFLSAFAGLLLLASVRLAREPGAGAGSWVGLALVLATLSKTTGLVLAAFPPAAILLLGRREARGAAFRILAATYAAAAVVLAYPVWLFFARTAELEAAVGVRENQSGLGANVVANLGQATGWLWRYWTPGLVVLALGAVGLALTGRARREVAFLALAVLVPVAAFVGAAEIWYPRYLLVTTIPALALAAAAADAVLERSAAARGRPGVLIAAGALVLALVPALRFDYWLWTDPSRAPLPALDRFQYVVGWPSGYGVADTVAQVRQILTRHPEGLTIAVAGTSPTGSALRLLLRDETRLDVTAVASYDPGSRAAFEILAAQRPTYLLVSPIQGGQPPSAWQDRLVPVFTSFKPDGAVADRLYRLCPGPADCGT
jgi:hypothetical protein